MGANFRSQSKVKSFRRLRISYSFRTTIIEILQLAMEKLQEQIILLQEEVRNLRHMIEIMTQRLTTPCQEFHKDIVPDPERPYILIEPDRSEISLEWQVRRLTAQLTTAYNRIADLEEELMLRRHR